MMQLFGPGAVNLNLPDGDAVYHPHFFDHASADTYFQMLMDETAWQQDEITIFGKTHPQPRLTAFYGDQGKTLSYSGIAMQAHRWTETLLQIRQKIQIACDASFNTVLLNLYRDGRDSNGWHADDEKYLGRNPVIASVTFGAERVFQLRHNTLKGETRKVLLGHGSLLVMAGQTQHCWKHQIAKTTKPVGPRINLTFRYVH
jgi:alkylated DNA repair dioxygenase AlkB